MEGRTITGATTITLRDQLRARWTTTFKYMLVGLAIIVAGITSFQMSSGFLHGGWEIALEIFAILLMSVLFVLFYVVITVVVTLIFALRLGKDQRAMSYSFNSDGMSLRDRTGSAVTLPWKVMKRIREDKRAFRIAIRPMGERFVPKRAFSLGDVASLRVLMIEKLGAAAKLRR